MHRYQDLISVFDNNFYQTENTRLIKGEHEPIYCPANEHYSYHRIEFANGFFSSALHEVAHWLVAGKERRLKEDYGYWYCPDGRDEKQQLAFEQVEMHPQAIEWALSVAAGFNFNVSADNLNGMQTCRFDFQRKVYQKVSDLLNTGFNERTERLINALCLFYNTPYPLTLKQFTWQDKSVEK